VLHVSALIKAAFVIEVPRCLYKKNRIFLIYSLFACLTTKLCVFKFRMVNNIVTVSVTRIACRQIMK